MLVRLKNDRDGGGKRNNWLLIKHKDEWSTEDGEAAIRKDKSVASGRTMQQISEGKGKAPTSFMLSRKHATAKPDAVWHSNKSEKAATRPTAKKATVKRKVASKTPRKQPARKKA